MKVKKSEILLHSVTRLLHRHAEANVQRLLIKSHPSEIAAVVRQLADDDAVAVMHQIRDTDKEAPTFVELESGFLRIYLDVTGDKQHIADVLQTLSQDQAAALLSGLGEETARDLLSLMKQSRQEQVSEILGYGEDSCGRIMSVNVFALNQNATAEQAIAEIQKRTDLEGLFYIYIIDDFNNLVGVVSMRQVLQVKSDRPLKDFMTRDLVRVSVFDAQEKAAGLIEEYNYVSLPVVDDAGKLVGMVRVDDIIDYLKLEAQEEVMQMAGVEREAIDAFSFWRAFSSRAWWYGLLFVGGILCSEIILYYFAHFPQEAVYFCFAPLILRLGGNIAFQGITLVNQGVLNADIERRRALKALSGQGATIMFVATLIALAVFVYGGFRFGFKSEMPLAMGVSVVAVSLFSMVMGALIPFMFQMLTKDVMPSSSRFVHFLMDALNLLVFFQSLWFFVGR